MTRVIRAIVRVVTVVIMTSGVLIGSARTPPDVVERELFRPLRLTHTRYRFHDGPTPAMAYTHMPPAGQSRASAAGAWYAAWQWPKPGHEVLATVAMGGGFSTADDLARLLDAFTAGRVVSRSLAARMMTGQIQADYGGRDGYGFETPVVNGVRIVGHRGLLAGSSNEVELYPDLGYVVVVLGNTDTPATQEIATHLRMLLTGSSRHSVAAARAAGLRGRG